MVRVARSIEEALLDRHPVAVEPQVGEDGIGDQRTAAASPSAGERVGDLVAPGERPELVAPLPRGFEEADRGVVGGEGVGLQGSGGVLGADQARLAVEDAGLARDPCAALGDVPERGERT